MTPSYGIQHMCAESIAMGLDKPRRHGPGKYMACCPAHDDSNPSLSITDADGTTLVFCFSGCSQDDVIDALRSKGLWSEKKRSTSYDVFYSPQEFLEMDFYIAIADEDMKFRALTVDENAKYNICKRLLKDKEFTL